MALKETWKDFYVGHYGNHEVHINVIRIDGFVFMTNKRWTTGLNDVSNKTYKVTFRLNNIHFVKALTFVINRFILKSGIKVIKARFIASNTVLQNSWNK